MDSLFTLKRSVFEPVCDAYAIVWFDDDEDIAAEHSVWNGLLLLGLDDSTEL